MGFILHTATVLRVLNLVNLDAYRNRYLFLQRRQFKATTHRTFLQLVNHFYLLNLFLLNTTAVL